MLGWSHTIIMHQYVMWAVSLHRHNATVCVVWLNTLMCGYIIVNKLMGYMLDLVNIIIIFEVTIDTHEYSTQSTR